MSFTTKEDVKLSVAAPGVLANDFDPDTNAADKHPITGVIAFDATSTKGGTWTMKPNGSFDYTPAANFQGIDTFTYTISDGFGATDTATVTINVGDINDAPDAVDDTATTNEGTSVFIPVLANDTDIDGNPPIVTAVTPPRTALSRSSRATTRPAAACTTRPTGTSSAPTRSSTRSATAAAGPTPPR